MNSWCSVSDGAGGCRLASLGDGLHLPPATGFVWCHLDGRSDVDRRWLEAESALPSHIVTALTALETRPRCESVDDGILINMRGLGLTPDDDDDPLVSIRIWAEKGRVVSLGYRRMKAMEALRDRMKAGAIHDPGDLIAALATIITDDLDPVIAALGDAVDDCEADLDPANAFQMRRTIARARSEAIGYRRFVVPQRQALERMATLEVNWLEPDDRQHLARAADGFARMAEELEAVRERSALLHEQLTDLRAETIETRTLILAIVALVFMPLTFITGLFGMNYPFPFQGAHWPFWAVTALCVLIAAGILIYFSRRRWLRR